MPEGRLVMITDAQRQRLALRAGALTALGALTDQTNPKRSAERLQPDLQPVEDPPPR